MNCEGGDAITIFPLPPTQRGKSMLVPALGVEYNVATSGGETQIVLTAMEERS